MQGLTYAELKAMSYDDLIAAFDREVQNWAAVGLGFIREEIFRRDQDKQTEAIFKQTEAMLKYTRSIKRMTFVMTAATIVNVVIACILLAK